MAGKISMAARAELAAAIRERYAGCETSAAIRVRAEGDVPAAAVKRLLGAQAQPAGN
ncbi:hypothetical protein GI374_13100 [Paracoccus sp. S-4012]|uniref:DUF411 domain-containing protein n=1 Tax=Paracoccus sp. S-4012 TaxID=2665648 RepID=UPI0012AF628B|nr:DUF411 domain-containing protein [Paracoccus sp. S-4012]MRX51362.1 hypothetical protein [Paracoccus sp. S-4012]